MKKIIYKLPRGYPLGLLSAPLGERITLKFHSRGRWRIKSVTLREIPSSHYCGDGCCDIGGPDVAAFRADGTRIL